MGLFVEGESNFHLDAREQGVQLLLAWKCNEMKIGKD